MSEQKVTVQATESDVAWLRANNASIAGGPDSVWARVLASVERDLARQDADARAEEIAMLNSTLAESLDAYYEPAEGQGGGNGRQETVPISSGDPMPNVLSPTPDLAAAMAVVDVMQSELSEALDIVLECHDNPASAKLWVYRIADVLTTAAVALGRAEAEALFKGCDAFITRDHPEFGLEVTVVVGDNDATVTNQPDVLTGVAAARAALGVTPEVRNG